jgi:hypothetical protein
MITSSICEDYGRPLLQEIFQNRNNNKKGEPIATAC